MTATEAVPDWREIRALAEKGVSFRKLSESYGQSMSALYCRSSRENWLTPEKTRLKIGSMLAREQGLPPETPPSPGDPLSNTGALVLAETWQQRADSIREISYKVASRAIREAEGRLVVESASDLAHAVKVARQATGLLDDKQPTIQLGIFAANDDPMAAGMPCFDAEIVESRPMVMADPFEL